MNEHQAQLGRTHEELISKEHISSAFASLFGGISIIVSTEKILAGNHIDLSDTPLLSMSQLIPFLVGLFTFVTTI